MRKTAIGLSLATIVLGGAIAAAADDVTSGQSSAAATTSEHSALLSRPEVRQLHPRENGLDMLGNVYTQKGPSGIRITVDTVRNSRAGGISGTLQLEVWATTSVPVFGTTFNTFTLGWYNLGQLNGGYQFTNVNSGLRPYTPPPSGCYWITLALLEFDGFAYRYQDLYTGVDPVSWTLSPLGERSSRNRVNSRLSPSVI